MPNQLDEIYQLSKKYKFKIIEDASHAIEHIIKITLLEIVSGQISLFLVFIQSR